MKQWFKIRWDKWNNDLKLDEQWNIDENDEYMKEYKMKISRID